MPLTSPYALKLLDLVPSVPMFPLILKDIWDCGVARGGGVADTVIGKERELSKECTGCEKESFIEEL